MKMLRPCRRSRKMLATTAPLTSNYERDTLFRRATGTRSINLEAPPATCYPGWLRIFRETYSAQPQSASRRRGENCLDPGNRPNGPPFHIALSRRQSPTGFIQPQSLHKCGRRTSQLIFEAAGELPWAKRYLLRQSFDGKIIFQMGHHPGCQIGEAAAGLRLKFQRLGILFLPARTF